MFIEPGSQPLYPQINALVRDSREQAAILPRRALAVMMAATLTLASALVAAIHIITGIILSKDFEDSVLTLRRLSFLVPLIAGGLVCWTFTGWSPSAATGAFNTISISAGTRNVGLASPLPPLLQAVTMALAVIVAAPA